MRTVICRIAMPLLALVAIGVGAPHASGQSALAANSAEAANESGRVMVAGRSERYRIRRLPVSSFPDLPAAVANALQQRGCMVPQTFGAHGPENVANGSFERAGSADWAALCSSHGTVSLLVFFASAPQEPAVLASAPETERLQVHDPSGVLGFNWGLDPASPRRVREAQAGLPHRPPPIDHDALADSTVDDRTVYHYYAGGAWRLLDVAR